jgi:hypothetical protein
MQAFFIIQGAQAPEAALTVNRVALGTFFAISGYHKLFNASGSRLIVPTGSRPALRARDALLYRAALAALTSPRLEYIPAIPTDPRMTGSDMA